MKKYLLLFTLIFFSILSVFSQKDTVHSSNLEFIENKNQWNENVLYKANIDGGVLFLEKNCFTYAFYDVNALMDLLEYKFSSGNNKITHQAPTNEFNCHSYKVNILNYNKSVKVSGKNPSKDYNNYFIGNEPKKWAKRVRKFDKVLYSDIYQGIDMQIYEKDFYLKYDFIVHPNVNPKKIELEYNGVENLSLNNGNLIIKTTVNKVIEVKPYAWQFFDGEQRMVQCKFKLHKNKLTFAFPKGYDKSKKIIIDPVLIFASYSGSAADNWGYTATYDDDGYLYAGGCAFKIGYPTTTGAYQTFFGGASTDISISKYDTSGIYMIYSTYLGGNGSEVPQSLVVNNSNELFVLGVSGSSNFPTTTNAYDVSFGGGTNYILTYVINFTNGSDIVISRLGANGDTLMASTYFGGSGNDGLNGDLDLRYNYADDARGEILLDKNNNCYVVSTTASTDLPVSSTAFQKTFGGSQDACIFKLDNDLSNLFWSSYLGGDSADAGFSIVLDDNENVFISGGTRSTNFPVTSGVIQPTYGGGRADGFITNINKKGTSIINSTYYGSNLYDQVYFVKRDKAGDIYVLGQSADTSNMFLHNALWYTTAGGQFISKINNKLDSLIWSTKWGVGNDSPDVSPTAFMVDLCNSVYLSAWGGSTNFFGTTTGLPITSSAFQTTTDGSDYYFMVINDSASALVYATFYGGNLSSEHVDGGTSRFDRKGKIYQSVCAGCGWGGNDDFPTTTGAWSNINGGPNCNNAVIKFDFKLPLVIADFDKPLVGCAPYTVNFSNTSQTTNNVGIIYHWDFDDGTTSTQINPAHTYYQSGIYNVMLAVFDTGSCNFSDTLYRQVVVLSGKRDTIPTKHICLGQYTQIGIYPISDPSITYTWSPATALSNTTIANPIASPTVTTEYTIFISNTICEDTITQFVEVYDLDVDAGNDTTLCKGDILLTAKSHDDSLFYQWSDNPNFTNTLNLSPTDSTALVSITSPTTFYVKIHNQYGCEGMDSVNVDFRINFSSPTIIKPKCNGDSNGEITINPIGGSLPYSYLWSNAQTAKTINNLSAGTYTVTVYDADSCYSASTVNLLEPLELSSNLSSVYVPCHDACVGKADVNPMGGTSPYSFIWSDGQITNPAVDLCDGFYYITITDINQCVKLDTVEVIDSAQFITIFTTLDGKLIDLDTIYEGESVQIETTYLGKGYNYSWEPPTGLNNPNISNPIASPKITTTYVVTIVDQYGCLWTDTITLIILDVFCDEPYIFIPNAFTPNGDNKNDFLFLRSNMIYDFSLKIFNRWGELIFETSDLNKGWDGTYKGKNCPPGVFVFYLDVVCHNKQIFKKKGNITLIR